MEEIAQLKLKLKGLGENAYLKRRDATRLIASYKLATLEVKPHERHATWRKVRNTVGMSLDRALKQDRGTIFTAKTSKDCFSLPELADWARQWFGLDWGVDFGDLPGRAPRIRKAVSKGSFKLPETYEGFVAEIIRLHDVIGDLQEKLKFYEDKEERNRARRKSSRDRVD